MSDHNNIHRKREALPLLLYVVDRGSTQHFYLRPHTWLEHKLRSKQPLRYYVAELREVEAG